MMVSQSVLLEDSAFLLQISPTGSLQKEISNVTRLITLTFLIMHVKRGYALANCSMVLKIELMKHAF